MFVRSRARLAGPAALILALHCGGPSEARVEKVNQPSATLDLRLVSLTGSRDGGRFDAAALFSGDDGTLAMDMTFQMGVPTVLTGGSYRFETAQGLEEGDIQSSSVTFLGGQSDRPNLGGVFLLRSQGAPRFRVRIPTMETKRPSEAGRREPESRN